jgi:hypothetical protein
MISESLRLAAIEFEHYFDIAAEFRLVRNALIISALAGIVQKIPISAKNLG